MFSMSRRAGSQESAKLVRGISPAQQYHTKTEEFQQAFFNVTSQLQVQHEEFECMEVSVKERLRRY